MKLRKGDVAVAPLSFSNSGSKPPSHLQLRAWAQKNNIYANPLRSFIHCDFKMPHFTLTHRRIIVCLQHSLVSSGTYKSSVLLALLCIVSTAIFKYQEISNVFEGIII